MHKFNSPPSWPVPPTDRWRPPIGWSPDPAWPPAPDGWKFWLNGRGMPASGPIGAFGAVQGGRLEVVAADSSQLLMTV
ncbi:hypothetical protein [Kribbella deserti]|uniref:Uncharacterized protein n=1 Tax=Kribbella deserti TaxID=1926257 RepID=A0ABV6QR56_9ACTN